MLLNVFSLFWFLSVFAVLHKLASEADYFNAVRHQFLRMILFLGFSPCALRLVSGSSDVCFDVGFMNRVCCVYCLPSLNSPPSVFKIQRGRFG